MGGITLAVRAKTGRDPVGYFSDLRTRGNPKATSAVAAIRAEARTTIWNPKYLSGLMREGPSAAGSLTETVRNLYGWNVMQPKAIDEGLWNETYATLIDDKHRLGMQQFFETKNPYALQDMTAIMLETARKGYWAPTTEVLARLASLHADLVSRYGAGCSYETCGNAKLREFVGAQLIAPGSTVPAEVVAAYQSGLKAVLEPSQAPPEVAGIELTEKQQPVNEPRPPQVRQTAALAGGIVLGMLLLIAFGARRGRNR
jgi:cobaltochelatase CobN